MYKRAVVLLAVIGACLAAKALMKPDPKPEKFKNVEGCYIKQLDQVIPYGESAPSQHHCMEYRCGGEYVDVVSCGAVSAAPPCQVVKYEDVRAHPYPKCCPQIKCPQK
ncbi:venom toxin OcyC11 [Zerene cesonia]|uniref:venom toxin OcyC11 n=1 Tax=Zerene cesonia TaxID=33412 RepID=UPI0018E529ED|nr:venom toxin OcyC11 [Zerene cesonia]